MKSVCFPVTHTGSHCRHSSPWRNTFLLPALLASLTGRLCEAMGQCPKESARLTASDGISNDNFGIAVALSGNTALIGAHHTTGGRGSAYVFVLSGATWTQEAELTASDAASLDEFGVFVWLDGDTALVGAHLDNHAGGTDAGSAYVFVRSGGIWTEQAKLTASDAAASDEFGWAVAVSGDTALIGACRDNHAGGTDAGSAYVFVRSGSVWTEQAKLMAADAVAGDLFGQSVALDGDTAVIGSVMDSHGGGSSAGSAYVFVRSGGVWTQQAKLIASDASSNDRFGNSVALSGEATVVGAYLDDPAGEASAGSAYVFARSASVWTEEAKLIASDVRQSAQFGISVALTGNVAAVGADENDPSTEGRTGSAYLFERSGSSWNETALLFDSKAVRGDDDHFGYSIAVSTELALAGAYLDDYSGLTDAGTVFVYDHVTDFDADAVPNLNDVCPYSSGGCPVDAEGRPIYDLNDDCAVNGLDIQVIVDEILMGAGWDITAAVDDLLKTCSPCS